MKVRDILAVYSVALTLACGADASFYPGGDHTTSVISGSGADQYGTPVGGTCLVTPGNPCLKPQQMCGDGGQADVLLNPDGSVLSTLCYPAPAPGTTVPIPGQGAISTGNNGLVVLKAGQTVNGNVSIDGNNATVFGAGPAASVITGSLTVIKNNAVVRGVYIHGDTVISGNNTSLFYCVIVGNVIINSNNNILADCDIYGKVTVNGNNNQLVSNRVQGGIDIAANNTACRGDVAFTDVNLNYVIEPAELGPSLACN